MTEYEEGQDEILKALGRQVDGWDDVAGAIVTKYVVVAEIACPDGSTRLHRQIWPEQATTWQITGMLLSYADDLRSLSVRNNVAADDD